MGVTPAIYNRYLVDDTRTTIYRDISCDVTPNRVKIPGRNSVNENPPPCCGLLFVFGSLPLPSSWRVPRLAFFVIMLSISWTHHLIMDGAYHQQTATLSPHDSACYLSACFFVSFFFRSCYVVLVGRYEVPSILLLT